MKPRTAAADDNNDNLFRLLGLGYLVLIATTWPLWIPHAVFPQIPLLSIAGRIPRSFEWGLLVVLLAALGVMLLVAVPPYRRGASLLVAFSTLGLVCIDQHRLQPWAWQFVIISLVLASARASTARTLWRALVIGIYAWSAWSKMDYGFCVHHGPFLLEGLCKSVGLANGPLSWPTSVRYAVAAMIPVAELLIAVGLCWPRTRRFGVCGAAMMHIGLLLALGPFGHKHQPGVLVWNLFFLVQNWFLFVHKQTAASQVAGVPLTWNLTDRCAGEPGGVSPRTPQLKSPRAYATRLTGFFFFANPSTTMGDSFAKLIVLAAMIWPLFEPIGLCDHWPAWSVYAANPERVIVFLDEAELPKLPENLKRYLGLQSVFDDWHPLRIDRWSLDVLHAPIYPQDRFQVGVALGLARDLGLNQIRIVVEGPANRWTGKRVVHEYVGLETIEKLADSYRCGARPRTRFHVE